MVFLSSHELDDVQLVGRLAIIEEIVVIDTVDGLRRVSPRTIEFRFPRDVDPPAFAARDGVRVLDCADGRVRLSITGSVGPLLPVAADLDPVDTTARPADLDELLLGYYRTTPEPAVEQVR